MKTINRREKFCSFYSKQSGSVLIVVIFVVVVMGLLAGTMARLEWSNQDTQSREIIGNRAWFIAHSANEWALTQLYPLGGNAASSDLSSRCGDIAAKEQMVFEALFQSESGYESCEIRQLTCSHQSFTVSSESATQYNFYKLHSQASCSDSQELFSVERSQDVVVKEIK